MSEWILSAGDIIASRQWKITQLAWCVLKIVFDLRKEKNGNTSSHVNFPCKFSADQRKVEPIVGVITCNYNGVSVQLSNSWWHLWSKKEAETGEDVFWFKVHSFLSGENGQWAVPIKACITKTWTAEASCYYVLPGLTVQRHPGGLYPDGIYG